MPEASYPNFAGKHAEEAMYTAADFIAYMRQVGAFADGEAPRTAVLCYQRSLYDAAAGRGIAPRCGPGNSTGGYALTSRGDVLL